MIGGLKGTQSCNGVTLMLLVANLVNTNYCEKSQKISETLTHRYSFVSSQQELSYEYRHCRIKMTFNCFCDLVPWKKVASVSEGLSLHVAYMNDLIVMKAGEDMLLIMVSLSCYVSCYQSPPRCSYRD